jgi:hypothetical protein
LLAVARLAKKSLTKPSYQLLDGCGIMVAMLALMNQESFSLNLHNAIGKQIPSYLQ